MRISDWSSDVCSSDLLVPQVDGSLNQTRQPYHHCSERLMDPVLPARPSGDPLNRTSIEPDLAGECAQPVIIHLDGPWEALVIDYSEAVAQVDEEVQAP